MALLLLLTVSKQSTRMYRTLQVCSYEYVMAQKNNICTSGYIKYNKCFVKKKKKKRERQRQRENSTSCPLDDTKKQHHRKTIVDVNKRPKRCHSFSTIFNHSGNYLCLSRWQMSSQDYMIFAVECTVGNVSQHSGIPMTWMSMNPLIQEITVNLPL